MNSKPLGIGAKDDQSLRERDLAKYGSEQG